MAHCDVRMSCQQLQDRNIFGEWHILTPKDTLEGPVLEVSGDVALLRTGDVLVESPLEGIAQQYTAPRMALANIMLDPSLPAKA